MDPSITQPFVGGGKLCCASRVRGHFTLWATDSSVVWREMCHTTSDCQHSCVAIWVKWWAHIKGEPFVEGDTMVLLSHIVIHNTFATCCKIFATLGEKLSFECMKTGQQNCWCLPQLIPSLPQQNSSLGCCFCHLFDHCCHLNQSDQFLECLI